MTWQTKWQAIKQITRMDKPIGTYLLLWPTYWALWIATDGWPSLHLLIVFTLGVFVMRSAGCVINDFADRKVDGLVKRTNKRPLVSGAISVPEGINFIFPVNCHRLNAGFNLKYIYHSVVFYCCRVSDALSLYETLYQHATVCFRHGV